MKKCLYVILMVIPLSVSAQFATLTISAGGGAGFVSQDFEDAGQPVSLNYFAPAAVLSAELTWDHFYLEMLFSAMFLPFQVTLGNSEQDLTNYSINMGLDFNAAGLGYEFNVSDVISLGLSLGFHVSSIMLSPEYEDPLKLTLEGSYGLIGVSVNPRIRFHITDSLVSTISILAAYDFSRISDELVIPGLGPTGSTTPAIVGPAGLTPLYKGFSLGAYITFGYSTDLSF